ncbi:MAG: cytochrome c oxidase subunit 4 [Actinomycetia bacterium]|nr:cytochrome c oxidase subunit 4 [Actinomycetes bacterium]
MKIEGMLFALGAIFFIGLTIVYGILARDIVGIMLLLFTGGLAMIAGFYMLYTSKAVFPRPEDRLGAEVDEADPEYGFFSPHSWWPLAVGFSAFVVSLGFIFAAWMFVWGIVILMIAITGWMLEYYTGDHAH